MTTSHKKTSMKLRKIQDALLSKIKEAFPLVELMKAVERRDGTVAMYLYAPYEDKMGILDQVGSEVADLVDEGVFIRILPLSTRLTNRAA